MSSQSTPLNNGQQAIQHTDRSKIFIGNNRFEKSEYNNPLYDSEELQAGTLMGRVAATGWVKKCDASANDGSQFPIGILANDQVIEGGSVQEVLLCVSGNVSESKVIFTSGQNKETTVDDRRLRDWLLLVGIMLKPVSENSGYDND